MPPLEICRPGPGPLWPVRKYGYAYVAQFHFAFSVHFKVLRVSSIRQIGLRCSYVCAVICFVFLDKFKPINRSSQNLVWTLWFKRPFYFLHFSYSAINNISISVQTSGMGAILVVFGVGSLNMFGNRCSKIMQLLLISFFFLFLWWQGMAYCGVTSFPHKHYIYF